MMGAITMESLKRLRVARKKTAAQMASLCGVARTTWWTWETGAFRPRAEKLPVIARALRVSQRRLRAIFATYRGGTDKSDKSEEAS
jgi:transcriptional regulator with XRE-family HTH domain